MKTLAYLKGKAGEIFKPGDITNLKVSNIRLETGKILRTSFTDNHFIRYRQYEMPSGDIITKKTYSYGGRETVIEQANGKWQYSKV
jgi:hypothetical protein